MERTAEIQDLYAFHRWANQRFLDVVAGLDDEAYGRTVVSSFPSIAATLLHMLGADWMWLERWNGNSPTAVPTGWVDMDFQALREAWAEVEARQRTFVDALTDADLDRTVHARMLTGVEISQPLWVVLRHVANHGTYHRGQLTTLLRQVGAAPPSTDLLRFYFERG